MLLPVTTFCFSACHKPDGVKSDLAQLEDEVLAAFAQMESFVGPVPTPPVPAAPPVRYRKPYCILDVASNFVAETPPASAEFHNFIVLYNKIYVVTMGYEGDDFYHYISCRDSSGVVNTVKYEMPNSVTDGPITGVTYDVKYQKLIVVRAVQTYQVNLNGTEAEFLSINKAPTLAEQRQVATYEDKIYVTLNSLNIVLAYNRANLILSEAFQLSYKPRAICRTQNGKFFVAGDAVVEIYDKNFNELNKIDIGQDAGFSALHCYSDCEGAVAVHKHTNSVHKLRYIDVEDGIIETFVFPAEPKAMHLLGDKLLVLTAQSTFGSVQLTL